MEERFTQACALLPPRFAQADALLAKQEQARVEELRLRAGKQLRVLLPEGERTVGGAPITGRELEEVIDRATEYSRYAAAETLRQGYLCVPNGFRLGVCGTAVMRDGCVGTIRGISSISIRIVRECIGVAEPLTDALFADGRLQSTLILSPPGGGKTTLLRDMIRCISQGSTAHPAMRVAVVDERSELAMTCGGIPQTTLGTQTDVLDGCPKALGIPMLLRAMNPQVIAVDEITAEADIAAICTAANCGVILLATIHAASRAELVQKPLWRRVTKAGVFSRCVTIRGSGGERTFRVDTL